MKANKKPIFGRVIKYDKPCIVEKKFRCNGQDTVRIRYYDRYGFYNMSVDFFAWQVDFPVEEAIFD